MSEITLRDGTHEITFLGERPYPLPPEGVWEFSDLVDWTGQTDDKMPVRERPQAHGAFDVERSLRSSRGVSFNARFVGNSEAQAEEACAVLDAIGAEAPAEIIVTTSGGASSRVVTIEKVTPLDARGVTTASRAIDLIARDPRRYDVNVQSASTTPAQPGQGRTWPAVWPLVWPAGGSSGRITLTNTGKAPSAPTFILDGGFDTALITCLETGARIGFNRHVPVGSEVVIDTKARRATIDGQSDVSRWLQYREWELIPPGASRTYQFDATGVVTTPVPPVEVDRNRFTNPIINGASATGWTVTAGTGGVANIGSVAGVTPPTGIPATREARATWTTAATGGFPSANAPRMVAVPGEVIPYRLFSRRATAGVLRLRLTYLQADEVTASAPAEIVQTSPSLPAPGTAAAWWECVGSTPAMPAGTAFVRFEITPASGELPAAGFWIGVTCASTSAEGSIFDGSTAASGKFTYGWAGAMEDSESVKWFTADPAISATLEGQVRSAWW